jgi:signal transduction histidine kinase
LEIQGITARKKKFNYLIPLVIICILATFVRFYYVNSINKIENAVTEHSKLLAEPMWDFNTPVINIFLSVIIAREEYQRIQVFDLNEQLISDIQASPLEGLDKILFNIKLLQTRDFSAFITKDGQNLGKITVLWRDTSIYLYAYAVLVAILFYIITWLYSSTADTNRTLKSNIVDLHKALDKIKKQKDYIENIYNVVPEGLITIDKDQKHIDWNMSFERIVETWAQLLNKDKQQLHEIFLIRLFEELKQKDKGEYSLDIDGSNVGISYVSSHIPGFEHIDRVISLYDVTEITNMRLRLSQSEKLESVGRLAAGIAHEINTPTQYVLTNIHFLSEAFGDLTAAINNLGNLASETSEKVATQIASTYAEFLQEADWDYLGSEIPHALEQSEEGMQRIQTIVTAMKHFSHPSGDVAGNCDLNQAIESTVTVTQNEWKLIADMDLSLEPELPAVPCFLDQINQVVLIMIVNAVHAIEEQLARTGESRGTIAISTRSTEQFVELAITDNGIGMSKEVKKKVFDPFFTTKAVNKGTGQGLAIANDIIVNKHKGAIKILAEEGKGTTFLIQLPFNIENPVTG